MELLAVFTSLCICLSMIITPCAGHQVQESQSSHGEQAFKVDSIQFSIPTLPRKLRVLLDAAVTQPANGLGVQVPISNDKQKVDASGKAYNKEENLINGSRGTRQEWVESTDPSHFFTMDYSHVRRRRPIHNKALPVGP